MAKFDYVIFDFDGTVADTGEGVFESIRYAVRMKGLEQPSEAKLRTFIGPPLSESFSRIYPEIDEKQVQQLIIHYRAKYSVDGVYKFSLYDGMTELLTELKSEGIKTAIASSKPDVFIKHIVKTCDLEQYFDEAVGAPSDYADSDKKDIVEEAVERLGAADKSRVLMIGDRMYDIVGAHKAGIKCAAVLFGYGSAEEFIEYGADYVADDCAALKHIISV